jgi:hypothetical protein
MALATMVVEVQSDLIAIKKQYSLLLLKLSKNILPILDRG